ATLKCWRLLRKLRCSTTRITAVVRAVVALELLRLNSWCRGG
ncbi:IS5/IS1182 family transposase, partial [Streptomyces halstedii]